MATQDLITFQEKQIRVALALMSRGPVQKKQHWQDPLRWFDGLPEAEQHRLLTIAERELSRAERAGIHIDFPGTAGYLVTFRELRCPPAVIYRRGEPLPTGPSVAVVGARAADGYGLAVTQRLTSSLAGGGAVIVSGGAAGVDRAAHGAALAVGGRTVVFLGSGLDVRQASEMRMLLDRILMGGGTVVSEIPLGIPALRHHFPERNRLIAASSDVIVVVQAALRSGSLHTAHEAIRLGRPVLVVPGDVCYRLNLGTNGLLAAGVARAVCHPDDVRTVLAELGRPITGAVHPSQRSWPEPGNRLDTLPAAWQPKRETAGPPTPEPLWPLELVTLLDVIDTVPRSAEEIAARAGLGLPEVVGALSVLQLEQRVERVVGNRFVKTGPLTPTTKRA